MTLTNLSYFNLILKLFKVLHELEVGANIFSYFINADHRSVEIKSRLQINSVFLLFL